ncbi:MAG: T9SS type A sorting domain-containing protein [Lewinella sp.]|uniref:T9SS type A sorting domain-containing protein n=1 Tax=Lewinella sp. TaxID=2004506 RepID=UPI003D6A7C16
METRLSFTLCIVLCLITHWSLLGQENCGPADNFQTFTGNAVEATLSASGSSFWDGDQAGFSVGITPEERITTILTQGLWIGGQDPGGNLKVVAARSGLQDGLTDFYPGPLNHGDPNYPGGGALADPVRGTTNLETCDNWDKVWMVTRAEIDAVRADFSDNGVLDADHPAVLSWPAKDNPFFFANNGFELPPVEVISDLAPFWDADGDGIYNPAAGDYPIVRTNMEQPDVMAWVIYNDSGGDHGESNSPTKLQFEFQQLIWLYRCSEVEWLNRTVFSRYQFTNWAIERLDSVHVGLWTDFELGCPEDDFIGSAPELNTYYAYNVNATDGNGSELCSTNTLPLAGIPPVQAVTFLDAQMSSFYYHEATGENTPLGLREPVTPQEYYNYLRGRFSDGSKMIAQGVGYDPLSSLPATDFAFPGRPQNAEEWSLYQISGAEVERFGVGAVNLTDFLLPGGRMSIDVAFSFHHAPDSNHLQQVNLMYDNVEDLRALYANNFYNYCEVTSTDELVEAVSVKIFPNPTAGQLELVAYAEDIEEVVIWAVHGQQMMRVTQVRNRNLAIDVSSLAAGLYFVQVKVGGLWQVQKVVKE